ncbi:MULTISPECIES: DNA adenine methylase [Mycolicibacter]|uniref:DNA adenine methylase n=2 Tax=Mycolicibacter TaxID=1073531 RepID=A0ABU5XLA5_9MYCO|nr:MULTISPECIES: DNA adenine methylase [unclassified Mycolicibacter]MEB3022981.1 DNA adenine methylase [Mycolicibacter sp. MYC098]MEB3033491.1 DNA adenine methylase [Mycolicibacter sp. MYC340]
MTAPPMAYYGGKTRLAERIVALLPAHEHYIEPFTGSMSVLLAKRPSLIETVNDLDGDLMNFWRMLRERPEDLVRVCALTPHSRLEHDLAYQGPAPDDLERARRTWVRISQGRTGTLRKTGWRYYIAPAGTATSMPEYLSAYVDRMAAAAERLHHVSLECRPGIEVIEAYGAVETACLYVDPPYLGSTRTRNYNVEMRSESQHAELLEAVQAARASVVLSGYASPLYDRALADWDRVEISSATGQGGTQRARKEVIWSNRMISEPALFDLVSAP